MARIRLLLLAALLALVTAPALAQPLTKTITSGTVSCPVVNCLQVSMLDVASLGIDITGGGTWTIVVQGLRGPEGTATWADLSTIADADLSAVTSITAAGSWSLSNSGFVAVRIFPSSYTSGTPVISVTPGRLSPLAAGGGGGGGSGDFTIASHNAAFGTAGSADSQVRSVQGIASGVPIAVSDNSGSLTVDGTVTVTDGAGALNVIVDSGTTAATQSGTWNITNVSGTVSLPTGAATSANQSTMVTALQLIDNIPITIGSTTSGQSGALSMGAVSTSAPTYTNAQSHPLSLDTSGALRVAITSGAGSGGTAVADDADFTAGTTSITPVGGFYQSTVTACTDGDTCAARITAGRAVTVAIVNPDGSAATYATDATHDSAANAAGPQTMAVARSSLPAAVGNGDAVRMMADLVGRLSVNIANVCADHARVQTAVISNSTSGNVEIVGLNGSDLIYVCGYSLIAGAATGVRFVYGTGTACATGETALTGVWSLASNGGITQANGGAPQFVVPAGNAFCSENSGANAIAGHVTYVRTAAP